MLRFRMTLICVSSVLSILFGSSAEALPLGTGDVLGVAGGGFGNFLTHINAAGTQVTAIPVAGSASRVATDAGGNVFVEIDGTWNRFDPGPETFTPVGFDVVGIDGSNRLYADVGGSVVQIDPTSGSPTGIAPTTVLLDSFEVLRDFAPDGSIVRLDNSNPNSVAVLSVDPLTGIETQISSGGLLDAGGYCELCLSSAIHASNEGSIFVALTESFTSVSVYLLEIDPDTGAQTALGSVGTPGVTDPTAALLGILSAPDGDPIIFEAVKNILVSNAVRYDLGTGTSSQFGGDVLPSGFGSPVLYLVPEPSTAVLTALGLALLATRRRRA